MPERFERKEFLKPEIKPERYVNPQVLFDMEQLFGRALRRAKEQSGYDVKVVANPEIVAIDMMAYDPRVQKYCDDLYLDVDDTLPIVQGLCGFEP